MNCNDNFIPYAFHFSSYVLINSSLSKIRLHINKTNIKNIWENHKNI